MNTKLMLTVVSVAVLAVALTMGGLAYAQGSQPPVGDMNGMMAQMRAQMGGGQGGMGGMRAQMQLQDGTGPMHETMMNALAKGLDLTRAELDSRMAAGETPYAIALAQGLTAEEFTALMQAARAEAVAQAVKDGTLTQEQADWMLSHNMGGMMNGTGGGGMMNGQGRGQGRGMGGGMMNGTGGTCPMQAPAATPAP